MIMYNSALV